MTSDEPLTDPLERVEVATGVLMHQLRADAPAARARLRKMAARGGAPVEGVAALVIGSAEIGCQLECADPD